MISNDPPEEMSGDALLGRVLELLAPLPIPPERRAMLRARSIAAATAAPVALMEVTRGDENDWRPLIAGVALKPLRMDIKSWTQTSLWRMDPGSCVPAHSHTAEEECLVVEGSVLHEGVEYHAGDFLLARPGLEHGAFTTPRGAVLLIRGELTPPVLALFSQAG